jgi:hypothetical protein
MAASLIKITLTDRIIEFRPEQVNVIEYSTGSYEIGITLVNGYSIKYTCPSPNDAVIKLAALEAAMNSGSGIVELNNSNSITTTTTTTAMVTTTTGEVFFSTISPGD